MLCIPLRAIYVQEAVEQLYRFSTRYFEDRDVECAERKESDVRDKMQHTVAILDSLKGKIHPLF